MSQLLHVHGHPLSQPFRSVIIFLKLSVVEYEFHHVNLIERQHLTEEYSQINPHQEVPAIVHEDFNLWESAAIINYIADVFNVDDQWYPKDIKIRARINSYLHWHHQNVREPIAGYILVKVIGHKFFGLSEPTPEVVAGAKAEYDKAFESLKWTLADTGYIGRTPEATVADIFAYSEVAQTILLGEDLSGFPEVKAWFEKIGANEVVKEVHQTLREVASGLLSSEANPEENT